MGYAAFRTQTTDFVQTMRSGILDVVDHTTIKTRRLFSGPTLELNGFHIHDDFPAGFRLNILG
jgi:hypothetical protein